MSMNHPTASQLTRRTALAQFLIAIGNANCPPATAPSMESGRDCVIVAWCAWHEAHERTIALCCEQQRLEAELMRLVGFPREPNLGAHWARWRAEDRRLGYSAARQAEAGAAKQEDRLARRLFSIESASFAGVVAKIHALLERETPGPSDDESPWPELRWIHADLSRLAGKKVPFVS
ncbi:hypothetical protein [Methylovirgula sp. 4M-Z18]|uniref:hypothetical protein n=1 Tax=Methylovirgula sp. 4M-Z18 TaxID=2293567 RepID=UPI000E3748D1|nr:hypothetical protein [Methylovirgula sp. 4M-Z18]RFB76682.1 hypothetical protein DYH55_19695 [Methylovirgula sp. 4M-Z18]